MGFGYLSTVESHIHRYTRMTTIRGRLLVFDRTIVPERRGSDTICCKLVRENVSCFNYRHGYDRQRGVSLKVTAKAAGGGAKFKGTQMREKQLTEMIEIKVKEAKEVCEGDEKSDECRVAWDEVEEVSQAKADLRRRLENQDPLEYFCQENPETDECRIYED